MSGGHWIGEDGWPIPYPADLPAALRFLPTTNELAHSDVDRYCRLLVDAYSLGLEHERSGNRPSSSAQADAQLRKLHKLCEALAEHIDALKEPALRAFHQEGGDAFLLREKALKAMQEAQCAVGSVPSGLGKPGAPIKWRSQEVALTAARIWLETTGNRPTATKTTETNRSYDHRTEHYVGPWPDFLGAVFAALNIADSVENQGRRAAEIISTEIND